MDENNIDVTNDEAVLDKFTPPNVQHRWLYSFLPSTSYIEVNRTPVAAGTDNIMLAYCGQCNTSFVTKLEFGLTEHIPIPKWGCKSDLFG